MNAKVIIRRLLLLLLCSGVWVVLSVPALFVLGFGIPGTSSVPIYSPWMLTACCVVFGLLSLILALLSIFVRSLDKFYQYFLLGSVLFPIATLVSLFTLMN